jgi:predicted Rossmann-fold nucleotide-binding protein
MKRVAVYCGSNKGVRPEYEDDARELGTLLAREEIELVYGGGCVGLMGIVANAVLEDGGRVIGVIPEKPDFIRAWCIFSTTRWPKDLSGRNTASW